MAAAVWEDRLPLGRTPEPLVLLIQAAAAAAVTGAALAVQAVPALLL